VVISVSKTETLLISTDPQESAGKYDLRLRVYGRPVRVAKEPVLLGVTFDSQLSFSAHAAKVQKRNTRQTGLLRRNRGKEWGGRTNLLQKVHRAYIAPVDRREEVLQKATSLWNSPTSQHSGAHRRDLPRRRTTGREQMHGMQAEEGLRAATAGPWGTSRPIGPTGPTSATGPTGPAGSTTSAGPPGPCSSSCLSTTR
jgi:hypothetical protein